MSHNKAETANNQQMMSQYSSEVLVRMIEESGALKKDIYTKYPMNRNTLDRWLTPGGDNKLDGFKIIKIAHIIGVDPLKYFPQLQSMIDDVAQLSTTKASDSQEDYLFGLVAAATAGDRASADLLKTEISQLLSSNIKYREELTRVMGLLSSLK
jgi:hypothetical protein